MKTNSDLMWIMKQARAATGQVNEVFFVRHVVERSRGPAVSLRGRSRNSGYELSGERHCFGVGWWVRCSRRPRPLRPACASWQNLMCEVEAGTNDWPQNTSVLCWHCSHPFAGPPIPKPVGYDERLDRYTGAGVLL